MYENIIELIYKGKVMREVRIPLRDIDREVKEDHKGSDIVVVNENGTTMLQKKHEFINVGERIAQVQYNTSATLTERGTVVVSQFVKEVASRGEDVWYYKNSVGSFEGTLSEAQEEFPDVDFTKLDPSSIPTIDHPELGKTPIITKPVVWETLNEYDGEKTGKPVSWDDWADATQTALDVVGLIPAVGEIADCLNGVISLARGDYAGAALSFAAMVPFFGSAVTGAKILDKAKDMYKATKSTKAEGVYDLMMTTAKGDIQYYIGQSNNVFRRLKQHFNPKKVRFYENIVESKSVIYSMPGTTRPQREIYEQFVILEKFGIIKGGGNGLSNKLRGLLNKVNPMGGRINLNSKEGREELREKALELAKKYDLPTEFEKVIF